MYIITAGCLCSPLFSVSLVYFTFIMPVDLHDFTNSLASAQSRDLVFTVLLSNETASSKPENPNPNHNPEATHNPNYNPNPSPKQSNSYFTSLSRDQKCFLFMDKLLC